MSTWQRLSSKFPTEADADEPAAKSMTRGRTSMLWLAANMLVDFYLLRRGRYLLADLVRNRGGEYLVTFACYLAGSLLVGRRPVTTPASDAAGRG